MTMWIREPGDKGHSNRGDKVEFHFQDVEMGINKTIRFRNRENAEAFAKIIEFHFTLGEPDKALILLNAKRFGGPAQRAIPILTNWLTERMAAWSSPKGGRCPKTIEEYGYYAKFWAPLGKTPINRITTGMVMAVLDDLWMDYAASTLSGIISVLRMAMDDAAVRELIPANPVPKTRVLKRQYASKRENNTVPAAPGDTGFPAYTEKEVNLILVAATHSYRYAACNQVCRKTGTVKHMPERVMTPHKPLRDVIFILLGCDAGLREAEIAGLEIQCINFELNYIEVRRQFGKHGEGPTKGREVRYLPMTKRLAEKLREWIAVLTAETNGNSGRWLFPSRRGHRQGKPLAPKTIWIAWGRAVRAAGVRYLTFHKTRHTFVSRMDHEGESEDKVAKLAGHKTKYVTKKVYTHPYPPTTRISNDTLDRLHGQAHDTPGR